MGIEVIVACFALLGLAALHLIYQLFTRGFTGAAFGARVLASSDKIEQSPDWLSGGHIRVHRLDANGRKLIGINVVCTGWLGWEELFVRLTDKDAQRLAEALEDATEQH